MNRHSTNFLISGTTSRETTLNFIGIVGKLTNRLMIFLIPIITIDIDIIHQTTLRLLLYLLFNKIRLISISLSLSLFILLAINLPILLNFLDCTKCMFNILIIFNISNQLLFYHFCFLYVLWWSCCVSSMLVLLVLIYVLFLVSLMLVTCYIILVLWIVSLAICFLSVTACYWYYLICIYTLTYSHV